MGQEWWASQVSEDQSPPAPPPGAQQGMRAHQTLDDMTLIQVNQSLPSLGLCEFQNAQQKENQLT